MVGGLVRSRKLSAVSDLVLAGRYFDVAQAASLRDSGVPEDAVAGLRRRYVADVLADPRALRQLLEWARGEFDGQVCVGCAEGLGDGDWLVPSVVMDVGGPRRGWWHVECQALPVVGHQYGVCGCAGFDTSRASARELWGRLRRG